MSTLRFHVNDRHFEVSDASPNLTLLYWLRQNGLTGTKEGCNEGDCGACTVVLVDTAAHGGPAFRSINACLVLLPMVHEKRVYTVEGLATGERFHPVQEALVREIGSQCGYCTPGVVMSMFEAAYREDLDEPWKIDDQMAGNLCRCTGYRPIGDATRAVAGKRFDDRFKATLDAAQPGSEGLSYRQGGLRFFTPTTLEELYDLVDAHADARLVAGGTDLSLEITKQHKEIPCLVSLDGIAALGLLGVDGDVLEIGAAARLSDVEKVASDGWHGISRMLRFFGARQIKNRGTVGGNLCTASPIGDMAPILVAYGATAVVAGRQGLRELPLEDFLVGYRKTALARGEILHRVRVPRPSPHSRVAAYKVSKRQELDISTVSAGLFVEVDEAGTVTSARFAFGGMSARPGARALGAEAAVVGQRWCEETVERAVAALASDFRPIDDHRGSAWYRGLVAGNLLRGFVLETAHGDAGPLPYRPTATVSVEVTP